MAANMGFTVQPQSTAAPMTGGGVTPFLNNAMNEQNAAINGAFSGPNNLLTQYYNAAALPLVQNYQNATMPNIVGNAFNTGNVGSSAVGQQVTNANNSLAQGLGTLGADIAFPAYETGLGIQQGAAQNAGQTASNQYIPAMQLGQIGQQQQQEQQNYMSSPYNQLSGAAGLIGPASGGAGSIISGTSGTGK